MKSNKTLALVATSLISVFSFSAGADAEPVDMETDYFIDAAGNLNEAIFAQDVLRVYDFREGIITTSDLAGGNVDTFQFGDIQEEYIAAMASKYADLHKEDEENHVQGVSAEEEDEDVKIAHASTKGQSSGEGVETQRRFQLLRDLGHHFK